MGIFEGIVSDFALSLFQYSFSIVLFLQLSVLLLKKLILRLQLPNGLPLCLLLHNPFLFFILFKHSL